MKGKMRLLLAVAVLVLLAGSSFDLYEFSMQGTTSSPNGFNSATVASSSFITQSVVTTVIASTLFAPSTTLSISATQTACTTIYPAMRSMLFLRVVSDTNQTPIVGAS